MAFGPKRVPGLYECVESNGTPKIQAAGSSLDEPDMSGPAPVYNSVKLITQFHISAINWQRVFGHYCGPVILKVPSLAVHGGMPRVCFYIKSRNFSCRSITGMC